MTPVSKIEKSFIESKVEMKAYKAIDKITQSVIEKSKPAREEYLQRVAMAKSIGTTRSHLSCGNLAHGMASCNQ